MIKLENLCKRFGDHAVIEGLSYTLPDKGIFALMGPSGLGKTTLLRLLAGLEQPSNGTLESDHKRVSVAFQEPRLISWLDCKENITFVLSENNGSSEIADSFLKKLELSAVANARPETLSGGMKQRLSLARALAFGGDLLLLDEPFTGLDAALKERIAPLIKAANPNGLTIVITHDKTEAALLGATVLHCEGAPMNTLRAET